MVPGKSANYIHANASAAAAAGDRHRSEVGGSEVATKTKPKSKSKKSKTGTKTGTSAGAASTITVVPDLTPLGDRIVVRPDDPDDMTASGLVIPDTAQDKPQRGAVLSVGPGRRSEHTGERIPMAVSEGDTVMYARFAGTEINVGGEDLLILGAGDVLAVIR